MTDVTTKLIYDTFIQNRPDKVGEQEAEELFSTIGLKSTDSSQRNSPSHQPDSSMRPSKPRRTPHHPPTIWTPSPSHPTMPPIPPQ